MVTGYRKYSQALLFHLFVLFVFTVVGCSSRSQWHELSPMPVGVCGFMAGVLDDKLYVIGGTTWAKGQKYWLTDCYIYTPDKKRWEKGIALPTPLAYTASDSDGKAFYCVGGDDTGRAKDEVQVIERSGQVRHICVLSQPISLASAVFCNRYLYVIGGRVGNAGNAKLTDAFFRIDTLTGKLEKLAPYPAGAIMLTAMTMVGNEIFVFGGASISHDSSTVINEDSAFAYSIAENAWRNLKTYPVARRGLGVCSLDEGLILIGGGYGKLKSGQDGFSDEAFLYSVSEDRYYPFTSLPYAVMSPGILKCENRVYIFGGEDAMKHRANHLYFLEWKKSSRYDYGVARKERQISEAGI